MEKRILFLAITITLFISIESKGYGSLGALAKDEGVDVAKGSKESSPSKCGERCDKIPGCGSFGFCREKNSRLVNCYPKSQILLGGELLKSPSNCASYRWLQGSKCNTELMDLINDYRAQKGLNDFRAEETLCETAWYHSWDQQMSSYPKGISKHSWGTNSKDGYSWNACTYDIKRPATYSCSGDKPKIFNSSWKKGGFELYFGQGIKAKASSALKAWKNSEGHNAMLTEWLDMKVFGAAIYRGSANAWIAR